MSAITSIALGIVVLAVILILAQVWDLLRASAPREQERTTGSLRLCVTCPQTKDAAYIQVGAPAETHGSQLMVLSCNRFSDGILRCHQECVRSEERSAA